MKKIDDACETLQKTPKRQSMRQAGSFWERGFDGIGPKDFDGGCPRSPRALYKQFASGNGERQAGRRREGIIEARIREYPRMLGSWVGEGKGRAG
ncbi:MAG: hypothetical protein EOR04_10420 [Mesorhizobium sp.]|uniref:hypothetical protein n=1 Tax=Mesorhizobium sp. TaxID=1871066 RepID=UPI000FE81906|nr:hypothetical protein [Mesorhizobium sp.]RWP42973.1 MAG: hypothetical protein EOR04_10420 [Mesorhizobium sp.]